VSPDDLENRWNLADIFSDVDAWNISRQSVESRLEALQNCAGTLDENAQRLLHCLDLAFSLARSLELVGGFAFKLSDEDTREARPLEMRQQASLLGTRFAEVASFVDPEILALGESKVRSFLEQEPGLEPYRHYIENVLRRAPHTLGGEAESVMAAAGMMSDTAHGVYSILANAEIEWPTITLSDGTEAHLNQSGYSRYRSVANRDDRRRVFDAFWAVWAKYERTCGVALYSQVKRDLFYSRTRKYSSSVSGALDANAVPETVYSTLIDATNHHLPTLHRYFRMRGRLLGVDDLRYFDIYPPLVSSDRTYTIDHGKKLVLDSLTPLGGDYVASVRHGFDNRWMDVYPRPGKKAGAYSSGSLYDVHPYVLMNYNDDYESVTTLAHEWGHAMHSHLANSHQPYPTADYSIFVAEVASTFNEALLLDHVLTLAEDEDERLFFLGSALEGLRGTFFRQTMFAEFELEIHRLVESGEALSGQRLSNLYGALVRRYHGHDEEVLRVDDAYRVEWAYIPHFYYTYYVYQYATSIAAASLFADEVLQGTRQTCDRYLAVLQAGGSEYPYELLASAGVDLATRAPYDALVARMNRIMDEIEVILERRGD